MLKVYWLVTASALLSLSAVTVPGHTYTTLFPPTGFITERLSTAELEKWKSIERVVFAENIERQPSHPTLRNLWQWIETSGHTVYIEFIQLRGGTSCTAGLFLIERFDPLGNHHIAVVKLNLDSINQAYVGPETTKENGFIPFMGLEKEERYAEVLGHELSHAVHILTDLDRARLVEESIQETNQRLLAFHRRRKSSGMGADLKHRLFKRDALLKSLENQAEEMEKVVWRELSSKPLSASHQAGRK
ncbi:MAG TPA: hypothetical protein PLK30_03255 [Blastocatellia bacterium]|nr:hypothetical protein [Blastocatellia bacterium]